VPSTENKKLLEDCIEITLNNTSYTIDVYDTPLGLRWIDALADNLRNKKILEKNFCFLGWPLSKRNLQFLVKELNKSIQTINDFKFEPEYKKINFFKSEDFQHSDKLPIGKLKPGLKLKHEACNLVHRYFEELQGTSWKLSPYYKQADVQTKYAIRQLNNICHEIETWVMSYRKYVSDPDWVRPAQITTFLNAPRKPLLDEDFELFKQNRYNRELGGVYLHWSQVGKTLYEVYRDEGAPKMTETLCSEVNHQKFYSGEFDIEWGRDICEDDAHWHRSMIDGLKKWLAENDYDWNDPKLALGYIKLGQVNLKKSFGAGKSFQDIFEIMSENINITKIKIDTKNVSAECDYPYSLEDDGWKQLQIQGLKKGYESHSLR
jgi:hypothetical protein